MEIGRNEEKKSPATLIAATIAAIVFMFAIGLVLVVVVSSVKPSRIDPSAQQGFVAPPAKPTPVVDATLPKDPPAPAPTVIDDTVPLPAYLDQPPTSVYVAPVAPTSPAAIIQPPSIFNHAGITAASAGPVPEMSFDTDPIPTPAPVQIVAPDTSDLVQPIDLWHPFSPVGKWAKQGDNSYHLVFRGDGFCYQTEAQDTNIPIAAASDASLWHTHFEGDQQVVTSGYDRFTVIDRNTILGDRRGVYVRVSKDN